MQQLENIKRAVADQKRAIAEPSRTSRAKALEVRLRERNVRHQIEPLVELKAADVVAVAGSMVTLDEHGYVVNAPSEIVRQLYLGASRVQPERVVYQQLRDLEHLIATVTGGRAEPYRDVADVVPVAETDEPTEV